MNKASFKILRSLSQGVFNVLVLRWENLKKILQKLVNKEGEKRHKEKIAICINYLHHTADKINKNAKEAIYAMTNGDEQTILLLALKRFTKVKAVNLKEQRRIIAKKVIEENKYCY